MPSSLETALVRQVTKALLRLFRHYSSSSLTAQTTDALYAYLAQSRSPSLGGAQPISPDLRLVAESVVADLQLAQAALVDDSELLFRHARQFASICEVKAHVRLSLEARHMLNGLLRDGVQRMHGTGDYKQPVLVASAQLALVSLFSMLAQTERKKAELVLAVSVADFVVAKK